MKFLKSIHRFIPGFRQLSANSMIIAATYYGAVLFAAAKYWYWGLALIALPFLVFSLLDLNREKKRRAALAISVAAGLLVLLGSAVGFSAGGVKGDAPQEPPASGASTQSSQLAPSASRLAELNAAISAKASADPGQAQYAFVSAKGSKVFHLPDCSSAKRIKPENLVGFATREEAVTAGLSPCKVCKP
jgi:hypothetical protein